MNIVEKLASEGHLTAEQVERIGRNVHDFMEAVDKDPVLMKEAMEKLCGWESAVKKLGPDSGFFQHAYAHAHDAVPYLVGSAALGTALGLGTEGARAAIRSVKDSIGKAKAYRTMMEENPHLSEEDPNITEKAFNTLFRFNPAYAQDPLVAGTFVKNIVDQERLDIGTVTNLVQARRHMAEVGQKGGGGLSDFFMKNMPGPYQMGKAQSEAEGAAAKATSAEEEIAHKRQEHDAEMKFWQGSEAVPSDDPRLKR